MNLIVENKIEALLEGLTPDQKKVIGTAAIPAAIGTGVGVKLYQNKDKLFPDNIDPAVQAKFDEMDKNVKLRAVNDEFNDINSKLDSGDMSALDHLLKTNKLNLQAQGIYDPMHFLNP